MKEKHLAISRTFRTQTPGPTFFLPTISLKSSENNLPSIVMRASVRNLLCVPLAFTSDHDLDRLAWV